MGQRLQRSPLSWAAGNGEPEVIKILLNVAGINPNLVNVSGRTPLSWAAGNGHKECVTKLLIESEEVKVNTADNRSQTPLS